MMLGWQLGYFEETLVIFKGRKEARKDSTCG